MAENIAKYGISLEFDKALKGLKKFKTEAKKLNGMQASMNAKVRNSKKASLRGEKEDLKAHYKDLERQSEDNFKKDQARLKQRRKTARANAISSITAPTGVAGMRTHYGELERKALKIPDKDKKAQMSRANKGFKESISSITAPTGAEGMRDYYKQLSKDADAHFKKVNTHQSNQKKQRDAYWKDQRKAQEQLGAAMARDVNQNLRAQKARVEALKRAKEAVMNSALMMEKEAKGARKVTQEKIRSKLLTAKTAEQVRKIVALERASLKLNSKKSFLMSRMESSSKHMLGNMASIFALGAAGTFVTRTGQDFEAVGNTMLAVSKDSKEAEQNLKFVREEAYRLGLGLKESAKGFAKMNAARGDMSLEDTKKAFTGIAEMSTLLGLSSEEGSRAINALQQMMSKGVVSAKHFGRLVRNKNVCC